MKAGDRIIVTSQERTLTWGWNNTILIGMPGVIEYMVGSDDRFNVRYLYNISFGNELRANYIRMKSN